jgi:hypothetical protein
MSGLVLGDSTQESLTPSVNAPLEHLHRSLPAPPLHLAPRTAFSGACLGSAVQGLVYGESLSHRKSPT